MEQQERGLELQTHVKYSRSTRKAGMDIAREPGRQQQERRSEKSAWALEGKQF
jgi:hypothetical protein